MRNLYLGEWEQSFLVCDKFLHLSSHISLWFRYINDIFVIQEGPQNSLQQCIPAMNSNDFNLKFTMNHTSFSISFLDITISKEQDGQLSSRSYRKPTAGNTILHSSSFHPKPLVNSIHYSQYLCTRRNCFNNDTFKEEADKLRERLLARGQSAF